MSKADPTVRGQLAILHRPITLTQQAGHMSIAHAVRCFAGFPATAPGKSETIMIVHLLMRYLGRSRRVGLAHVIRQALVAGAPSRAVRVADASHGPGAGDLACAVRGVRSEERRVGKECRSRWSPY